MDFSPSESASSPQAPLPLEAQSYYYGLPSRPRLVGRSSRTVWEVPSGPEAYNRPKVLGTVGRHPIKEIWEGDLARKVMEHLNSEKVAWTSIDVVRIGYVEETSHPVILWIGVQPKTLSPEDGTKVACSCKEILIESGIINVDVEIRESLVTTLEGPKLLVPALRFDPTVDVRNALTTTLGIPISGKLTPYIEGTGGFFIAEGGSNERLFLVTARHVVFKPNRNDNLIFEHKSPSTPHHEVLLLGDAAFWKLLKSIRDDFWSKAFMIREQERRIAGVRGMAGDEAQKERKAAGDELAEAKEAMDKLNTSHGDVSRCWASPDSRLLGHVVYSPPIEFGFGTARYTQDFALIEIDPSKIDATNFTGNAIGLGTKMQPGEFARMMDTNLHNIRTFKYPADNLLRLKGTIPDEDMRHPPALDQNGEPCLMVVKHGNATRLTIGRANDVRSCVHNYHDDSTTDFSLEWAILPYDNKSGAFSAPGDSGAGVADRGGRIGGIITSGAGSTDAKDITYVTSVHSVMEGIRAKFPKAHLNL